MTGSAATAASHQVIRPSGVVTVGDCFDRNGVAVREIDPTKGRGITSYITHAYDQTRGNVTQEKWDEWLPGDENTRGWFEAHVHPDMDEAFRVTQGRVTFRYWEPDGSGTFGTEKSVELQAGGYIFFPKNVRHEGWNSGTDLAVLCITGTRAGNTALQDGDKGGQIPRA